MLHWVNFHWRVERLLITMILVLQKAVKSLQMGQNLQKYRMCASRLTGKPKYPAKCKNCLRKQTP